MIIGFGHRKRVGKDYAYRIMNDTRANLVRLSFATPLYELCATQFAQYGMQSEEYYINHPTRKSEILPDLGKTPRQVHIAVGNYMRTLHPHIWIDQLFDRARSIPHEHIIITDVRFEVEIEAIRRLGGLAIKIERPGVPETSDASDDALESYSAWDHVIINHGDERFNEEIIDLCHKVF